MADKSLRAELRFVFEMLDKRTGDKRCADAALVLDQLICLADSHEVSNWVQLRSLLAERKTAHGG